VRALAQRSASAAKEIKTLIGESVVKVQAGTQLVDESGKALDVIMESIKNVSMIVGEIAEASREQAKGIEQVNLAVSQMDETTQQNAALVEEAAAAAKGMEHQSQQLIVEVSYFRTDEAGTVSTPGQRDAHSATAAAGTRSQDIPPVMAARAA
jgi:methyl-accepting chemotaxis protein